MRATRLKVFGFSIVWQHAQSRSMQTERAAQEDQFCSAFHRLHWELYKHSMEALETIQLTMSQYVALCNLERLGGSSTMCNLAEETFQSGPTMTRIIDRMLSAGLVARERDPNDRRSVLITLTEAGRAKKAEAEELSRNNISIMTQACSDQELEEINTTLGKLLDGMHDVRASLHGEVVAPS
jgi:DNA-binding MarR family transcriptional regulator